MYDSDGFHRGSDVHVGNGMGDDGDRLHDWRFDARRPRPTTRSWMQIYDLPGAVLIGKRMFDVGFEPWAILRPFGMPVFIVTHEAREPTADAGRHDLHVRCTDGIEAALERGACRSAGRQERPVTRGL